MITLPVADKGSAEGNGAQGMRIPGKGIGWKEFLIALKNKYEKDNVGDVAGNLTFQGVLAFFPFLIFLVSLASLFLDPRKIQNVVQPLVKVTPPEVTQILTDRLNSLQQTKGLGLLTVSVVVAIWAASSGVAALMRALNTAYDVREERPFWKVRGIAVFATLLTAVFSILATMAAVVTPTVAHFLGEPLGTVMLWLRLPVAGLLMMFSWAVLYYLLPDTEQQFRFITPGSVLGVLVWILASWGFSVYVNNFGKYEATYGALGGVVVMLFWMWISAQVLLMGAEINALIEHLSPDGKRAGAKRLADAGVEAKPEKARKPTKSPSLKILPLPDRLWALGAAVSFLRAWLRSRRDSSPPDGHRPGHFSGHRPEGGLRP